MQQTGITLRRSENRAIRGAYLQPDATRTGDSSAWRSYRVTAESDRSTQDAYLLSMMPHMHLRGAAFNYQLVSPKGKVETLLDIPHYDANWQTCYRLLEPLTMPAGSRFAATAFFDNSEGNLNNPIRRRQSAGGCNSRMK